MPELIEYLEDGCSLEAVPHTYGCVKARDTQTISNTYGFNIPNDFGTTDATDTYFHAISDTTTTYFYPPAVTNPSTPIVCTDIVAIQAFLDGLSSGITYTINGYNEIVLTYANPGDENIWTFWLGTNIPDEYTNKLTPTLHDLQVDTFSFVPVQVIKFKNQDGTYIDKYFLPSTTSNLTEVVVGISDVFNFGECRECKKEIFATHQRYYVTSGIGIPSNYVAYWLGETMETWLGQVGADTSNCFIHASFGILNGMDDGGVGTDLISPFTATTPGMPLTNVSLVQSMTNISAASMGLSSTDLIYAITNDNQPVWFLSPAAIALLASNTYLHPYMSLTDTPGNYDTCDIRFVAPYTIADVQQSSATGGETTCTPIQEIKEKDSCTEKLSYRYILENGNGLLVEASTLISNFDETNVKLSCPEVNFLEKEVCGTINGSTNTYELVRVYTRNPLTGVMTVVHYEDNFGNIITGAVSEVCCTCNTLCDAPLQLLEDVNFRCQSYGRIGGSSFTSKLLNIDWGNDTYHYYGIISPPAGTVPVTINGSSGVIWSGNINVASSISNLISGLNANDPNVNYANGTYWKTDENGGIRNRITHTTLVVNGVTYNPTATSGNNWPCTNHFPVECYTEIAVSTNAGGSWTTVKPKGLGFTLNSVGDVIIRDDGYGLGFANLIDHVNPYIIPYGVQVKTSINNSWMTEWSSTVNHSDVKYKVLYYFIPVADADCTPDPVDYENYFTAINIMASDGDVNLMAPATNANFTGINLNTTSVPNNNSYCESF